MFISGHKRQLCIDWDTPKAVSNLAPSTRTLAQGQANTRCACVEKQPPSTKFTLAAAFVFALLLFLLRQQYPLQQFSSFIQLELATVRTFGWRIKHVFLVHFLWQSIHQFLNWKYYYHRWVARLAPVSDHLAGITLLFRSNLHRLLPLSDNHGASLMIYPFLRLPHRFLVLPSKLGFKTQCCVHLFFFHFCSLCFDRECGVLILYPTLSLSLHLRQEETK